MEEAASSENKPVREKKALIYTFVKEGKALFD